MADTGDQELASASAAVDIDYLNVLDLQGLPPADRGRRAWLTLAACFFLEAIVWGYAWFLLYQHRTY